MADLAETVDRALFSPLERTEAALRLVPSPAPVEPLATELRTSDEVAATAGPQEAAATAEVEYAPMYYI